MRKRTYRHRKPKVNPDKVYKVKPVITRDLPPRDDDEAVLDGSGVPFTRRKYVPNPRNIKVSSTAFEQQVKQVFEPPRIEKPGRSARKKKYADNLKKKAELKAQKANEKLKEAQVQKRATVPFGEVHDNISTFRIQDLAQKMRTRPLGPIPS